MIRFHELSDDEAKGYRYLLSALEVKEDDRKFHIGLSVGYDLTHAVYITSRFTRCRSIQAAHAQGDDDHHRYVMRCTDCNHVITDKVDLTATEAVSVLVGEWQPADYQCTRHQSALPSDEEGGSGCVIS